ncbi:hypothetical protein KVV02_007565 [Mortierella alpina]|uniref:Uncharacterized protein n=1 Tax=Mortierella alpina TaxID=64518 RepID=A0A9P8A028_MORAP|nr:hypothetical protein KVV02_007565 [Mortierella alpina]
MSHQRSKSTSSISNVFGIGVDTAPSKAGADQPGPGTVPLSISIPRQRSMSTSFGLATSPIAFGGSSAVNPNNPFLNPIVSPSSGAAPTNASFSTSPPTSFASLSSSIPTSFNRRFSSSFTNPLNNHPAAPNTVQSQAISEQAATANRTQGGLGGLLRKFSVSGRSGPAQHSMDGNEFGPSSHQQPGIGPLSNVSKGSHIHQPVEKPPHAAVDALKPSQPDKNSRSSSPMRSMILNGQMLD